MTEQALNDPNPEQVDGQTDLFSVDEDGLAETQLTSHPADDRDPAWCANLRATLHLLRQT